MRLWGADTAPELLNEGLVATIGNYQYYNSAYNAAFRYDPRAALISIRCPILLLNPENDRFAFADERVRKVQPTAEVIHIAGLAGQLPWRQPDVYAEHVIRFVRGQGLC